MRKHKELLIGTGQYQMPVGDGRHVVEVRIGSETEYEKLCGSVFIENYVCKESFD